MVENEDSLERVIETLKEPVEIDPTLDQRVMAIIERDAPSATTAQRHWLSSWRTLRLSPLGGLATAAALAAVALTASLLTRPRESAAPADVVAAGEPGQVTQFVLVAPDADSVTLVGDFNDWSFSKTHLARQAGNGVWWVTVALPPGRYRYAFVVDGTRWRSDPNAPAAEDEFGRPNSVVTIGGA